MTSLVSAKTKAATFNLREQTERFLSPLNLHWAGVALLGLVNLYLLISMGVLWERSKSQDAEAQAQQRVTLKTAELAAMPLDGLEAKLQRSNGQAGAFYANRLPVSYSEIATELGALAKKDGVRLTRVGYSEEPVVELSPQAGQLTEVRLDSSLQGDYSGLVHLINGLERDHMFFVITGVALTGQDSGRVNLRMRATTYLRGLSTSEEAKRASTPVSTADSLADQAIQDQAAQTSRATKGAAPAGGQR